MRVDEKIFIRFVETSGGFSGYIKFGFSAVDPRELEGQLPKYTIPGLTKRSGGFWVMKSLSKKFAQKDSVMYYCVTSSGDVEYGVNGKDMGVCLSKVDTQRQLWGLVDLYANNNVIELFTP